jgi:IS4 transposase
MLQNRFTAEPPKSLIGSVRTQSQLSRGSVFFTLDFAIHIEYWDEENEQLLVFLTNQQTLAAATIADVYKDRWAIEFFRALKQNLRVKTFVGTSENALQLQIWTALIAMLLIKYLQLRASFGWSLSNLVARLRQQLFVYRDLWTWIDNPFQPPPAVTPALQQLPLGLD